MDALEQSLGALCALPGISGQEDAVADALEKQARALGYTVFRDPLGSLLCRRGERDERRPSVMVSAHMDEVGLIACPPDESGLVPFACVGGIDERVLPGKQVYFPRTDAYGVIGIKPIHLADADERGRAVPAEDLAIDVGALSKEEAESLVRPGDSAVFLGEFRPMGELVTAKAIDDRAGCAILLHLMEKFCDGNLTFCFLVQEEVGCRGAKAAAERLKPDYALVLEATTAADLAGVDEKKQVCALGKGAVVGFMDRATIYSKKLYRLAFRLAEEQNIPIQTKTRIAGGNDAGAIHTAAGGVETLAVSVPCRYLHSPGCVINPRDLRAAAALSEALLAISFDEQEQA